MAESGVLAQDVVGFFPTQEGQLPNGLVFLVVRNAFW